MMGGSDRVEFRSVEVLARNQHVLVCLVAGKLVSIPPGRLLPGSTIRQQGDVGTCWRARLPRRSSCCESAPRASLVEEVYHWALGPCVLVDAEVAVAAWRVLKGRKIEYRDASSQRL